MNHSNIDEQICRQCRGRCCQGHPGVWSHPQRFFDIFTAGKAPSAEQLSGILNDRQLTLRNLGDILIPAPQNQEQGCVFLHVNGCALPPQQRSDQCLALIPNLETLLDDQIHCSLPAEFGSGSARDNWRPLQNLLTQVCCD